MLDACLGLHELTFGIRDLEVNELFIPKAKPLGAEAHAILSHFTGKMLSLYPNPSTSHQINCLQIYKTSFQEVGRGGWGSELYLRQASTLLQTKRELPAPKQRNSVRQRHSPLQRIRV